ncbi:MarR family winged helix-turn-helix transcriptional regulator [Rhizobium sp. RCC_161_2]|uniref:MarR family winged helix-turn-helix transcriptional regulator n=1 Tax=Rhizobium sp. RCC_161_2 TaxID=3239219 RepID=UPI003525F30B
MLIIGAIDRMGGRVTPSALAASEGMSSAGMAALLRDLESSELVLRTPDTNDRRKIWVTLSPAGQQVLEQSRSRREAWLKSAMSSVLTPDEQAQLLAAGALIEKIASHP